MWTPKKVCWSTFYRKLAWMPSNSMLVSEKTERCTQSISKGFWNICKCIEMFSYFHWLIEMILIYYCCNFLPFEPWWQTSVRSKRYTCNQANCSDNILIRNANIRLGIALRANQGAMCHWYDRTTWVIS